MADAVVITRPLAQAQVFAERVAALGRTGIIFPLLEIHPLAESARIDATLRDLTTFEMVTFVSPNAIDAVLPRIGPWPPTVAIAVVGDGSRRRLAHYGLSAANARIVSPGANDRMDSESLLRQLDLDLLRGKRVLIVRGESGRDLLSDALREAGCEVVQLAAYRRCAPTLDGIRKARLGQLAQADNDWIVTSSEALRILRDQALQALGPVGHADILKQRLIVSHPRIAEIAAQLHFHNVVLTASGDDALLGALRRPA